MEPHGLYVWTHKSSFNLVVSEPKMYVMKWWNELWNDEILEGLSKSVKESKSVKDTKCWSALAYDEMNNEMTKS